MKFVYRDMGHILCFDGGYVNELVVENKRMFFNLVNSMAMQAEGLSGDCVLSISNKPVEFSKYADLTLQFAPFQLNRKSLITKLYSVLEKNAVNAENYVKTGEVLGEIERYLLQLSEDLPFEINCQKLAIGPIIRALSPEFEENDKDTLEKIFTYMELVCELDRDKMFIMFNMRTYFSDDEMSNFIESACLHDFKVLLVENFSSTRLKNVRRFTIDMDLCEF